MKIRLQAAVMVSLIGLLMGQAEAGTVLQQEQRKVGGGAAQQTVSLYMDGGKLRVENGDAGSVKNVMIFDGGRQMLWMIDTGRKTYMEITGAQVQQMGQQMSQMMKQMEEQMAQVPPAQRAMMEQMMKGRMGAMAPPQTTVREKSKGDKVGNYTCTRYEVLAGGSIKEEICAADPSQLQMDPSAFETFKALAKFFEPLHSMIPQTGWATPSGMEQIQGFPVQTITYNGQRPDTEWLLVKLASQSIDAGLFALPSGLKKTEMPRMSQMQ